MAITSPINIQNISGGIRSLKLGLSRTKQFAGNIKTAILNRTTFKRQAIAGRKVLQNRRSENILRRDQEDVLEATGISGVFKRAGSIATESAKGFLGRILDFITTLLVGWLLYNLPTILTMVKDLIKRVQTLFSLLQGFISNIGKAFGQLGNIFNAVLYDVIHLDFLDSQKKVQNAMKDLESTFDDFHNQFDQGFKLFTTPLGEGKGEEPVPPTGTNYIPTTPSPSRSAMTGSMKEALDIIGSHEADSSGGYDAMNQGTVRDSKGNNPRSGPSKGIIKKNLTDMTIGEVIQHQSKNLTNDNGFIHAAGRYQFIGNTLPSAMKNAGLKPSDKFSPDNQDLMAATLLKSRGLSPWTADPRSGYTSKERAIIEKGRKSNIELAQASAISQQYSSQGSSAESLANAAKSLKGMSSASGPGGGRIACVWAVNRVFTKAGITPPWGTSEYVPTAETMMIKAGYQKISKGQQRPGDLYICNNQNHIGIVLPNGNIISNSSSGAKFSWEASLQSYESEFKGPGKFYRLPGSTISSPGSNIPGQFNNAANSISANINSTINPQIDQRIIQQRRGQQIVYIDDRQPMIPSSPRSGGGGQASPQSVPEDGLNSLIKKQMLLDLAYT